MAADSISASLFDFLQGQAPVCFAGVAATPGFWLIRVQPLFFRLGYTYSHRGWLRLTMARCARPTLLWGRSQFLSQDSWLPLC